MCAQPGSPQTRIGLEVHVQLDLRSKAFCSCALPHAMLEGNSGSCPVCLGLPGSLPALNAGMPRLAVRLALALGAQVSERWSFDRKSYFYPDMPRGYQITQWRNPCAIGGSLPLPVDAQGEVLSADSLQARSGWRNLPLQRLHVEEDAGTSRHQAGGCSVDYGRAGTPLVEIVSEPELHSPREAVVALRQLRRLVRWLGVGRAEAETGGLRCDGNISLCDTDGRVLTGPVEVKNLNSLRFLERALQIEAERAKEALKCGLHLGRESRGYDEQHDCTFAMRDKETGADYRYSPEPDLPDLLLEPEWICQQAECLPLLPWRAAEQLEDLGLLPAETEALLEDAQAARWLLDWHPRPDVAVARAFARRLIGRSRSTDLPDHARAQDLQNLLEKRRITVQSADRLFELLCVRQDELLALAEGEGLLLQHDEQTVCLVLEDVLKSYPEELGRLRTGESRLMEFLLGQALRRLQGRADPRAVRELLKRYVSQEIDRLDPN